MDSHPYSHKTSNFTLGAPHEEVQGRQTKLHPVNGGFISTSNSEQNKQTEKNMSFIAVYHKFT